MKRIQQRAGKSRNSKRKTHITRPLVIAMARLHLGERYSASQTADELKNVCKATVLKYTKPQQLARFSVRPKDWKPA